MVSGKQDEPLIGILDMDTGNLRSVSHAVYSSGFNFEMVREKEQFEKLTHLIIPGVGAYSAAMQNLVQRDLKNTVLDFSEGGKPILGICLGMHLLASLGEEGGKTAGLALIPGKVNRLIGGPRLPIPHMGWNTLKIKNPDHPLFKSVKTGVDFYFVHSYCFSCELPSTLIATTDYGEEINSVVGLKNVVGVQFHPEKSQVNGLRIIENFCLWDGRC